MEINRVRTYKMLQVRIKCCIENCERKPVNERMILKENLVLLVLILSPALKFHKKRYLLRIMRKEVRTFATAFS